MAPGASSPPGPGDDSSPPVPGEVYVSELTARAQGSSGERAPQGALTCSVSWQFMRFCKQILKYTCFFRFSVSVQKYFLAYAPVFRHFVSVKYFATFLHKEIFCRLMLTNFLQWVE